jgi:Na+/H+-dicarboxylate symporter
LKRLLKIHNLIVAGILLGVLAGMAFEGSAKGSFAFDLFDTLGSVFLSLLFMAMIPLVIASLVTGLLSVGNPRKLGRIGAKALAYYLATTVLAVAIGLACVNAVRPGRFVGAETKQKLEEQFGGEAAKRKELAEKVRRDWTAWEFVKSLVPRNPIRSMTADPPEMLPIIVFSLLVGLAAALLPDDRRRPFADFMGSLSDVMLRLIQFIMLTAPVGAMALMARVVMQTGVGILGTLLAYTLTVLVAYAIQFGVVYSLTVRVFAGISPLVFWKGMRETFLTAFSTSSSAATLPVNLKGVRENLGVPAPIANFCLPLGATVNMDGTSIFQGVASVFIAQVYGGDISLGGQLSILMTALLASIGTAPVPGAGIIMLGVIMIPLGIPLEGIALILGVDRFLDMCRTVLNITGDAACSVMVAATEGELAPAKNP